MTSDEINTLLLKQIVLLLRASDLRLEEMATNVRVTSRVIRAWIYAQAEAHPELQDSFVSNLEELLPSPSKGDDPGQRDAGLDEIIREIERREGLSDG